MRVDDKAFCRGVVEVLTFRPLRRAWHRFRACSHDVDKDAAMRRYQHHCHRHAYHADKSK